MAHLVEEKQKLQKLKALAELEPKTFGEALKKARLEKGLTQEQLATMLGCSTHSIYMYEKNIRYPTRLGLDRIEKVLEKNFQQFIPPTTNNLGNIIKQARLNKNLTQQQLADLLGCHVQTIRRWERNERRPSDISKSKIEKILQTKL